MPLSSELSKVVLYLKLLHPLIKIGLEMFNSLTPLIFSFFHCVFHECPYPPNYQGLFSYLKSGTMTKIASLLSKPF